MAYREDKLETMIRARLMEYPIRFVKEERLLSAASCLDTRGACITFDDLQDKDIVDYLFDVAIKSMVADFQVNAHNPELAYLCTKCEKIGVVWKVDIQIFYTDKRQLSQG